MKTQREELEDPYFTVPHWEGRVQRTGFRLVKGAYHLAEYVDDIARLIDVELQGLRFAFKIVIGPLGRIVVSCTIGLAAAAVHEILFRRR